MGLRTVHSSKILSKNRLQKQQQQRCLEIITVKALLLLKVASGLEIFTGAGSWQLLAEFLTAL